MFQDKLWPDYDRRDLWEACEEYVNRNRRFGRADDVACQDRAGRRRSTRSLTATREDDGAITLHHDGTVASLRVVTIAEGLEMVSLTQILAWDLPLDDKICATGGRARPANAAGHGVAGRESDAPGGLEVADVMLRYNFPGRGLTDDALRTLIMMVLSTGCRRAPRR